MQLTPPPGPQQDVLLVGGGHSHVQVLRMHAMEPLVGARLTVVLDQPVAVYSGMVPGVVAGQYAPHEVEIDVHALARRAGAAVVHAAATGIDPVARRVHLEGRPPLPYDLCSLNVGSTVAGLDLPGVRAHALATRPIGRFVTVMEDRLAAISAEQVDVVVVGGGAGGVELAFAVEARLRAAGRRPRVTLVDRGPVLLGDKGAAARRAVSAAAEARGITLRRGTGVVEVQPQAVCLDDGERLAADLVLWVAGAAGPPMLRDSPLPLEERGFVRVADDLRVEGHDTLFAVGDCAVPAGWPGIPKAGVYAVREGPVLVHNLRAVLAGRPTRPYRPQRAFLALLNLGDGTAIGEKWGWTVRGAWVQRLKDRIDRRFMGRFQVLGPDQRPAAAFDQGMPVMPVMEAPCGGCAAKVGHDPLHGALSRLPPVDDPDVVLGVEQGDDVAALRHGDGLVVQSVDAFPAFTEDPWLVGSVAAHNALSDLFASGVAPRTALAVVTVPEDRDAEELLFQVLSGARAVLDAAGCTLVGGHSTVGEKLHVGFSVTGFAGSREELWQAGAPRAGDALVLSRPLGTGVLFHADMHGRAPGRAVVAAIAHMRRGNGPAAAALRSLDVHAVTDVTGFGLAGHLAAMLHPAGLRARLDLDALPALPATVALLAQGLRSTFHQDNRTAARAVEAEGAAATHPALELLYDPQTGGGLLAALPADRADAAVEALRAAGDAAAAVIGRVEEGAGAPGIIRVEARGATGRDGP